MDLLHIDKKTNAFPYLDEDLKTEVLIIGGGLTGAGLAYQFTQKGVDTVLIDAQKFGYGNTAVNNGLIQFRPEMTINHTRNLTDTPEFFYSFYEDVFSEFQDFIQDEESNYIKKDHLLYSDNIAGLNDLTLEYIYQKELGLQSEMIEKASPIQIKTGIHTKGGAGILNPFGMLHKLLEQSIEMGLNAFENTKAVQFQNTPDGYLTKTNYHNIITSDIIICATGTETDLFTDRFFGTPICRSQILTEPIENIDAFIENTVFQNIRSKETLYVTTDKRIFMEGETSLKNVTLKALQMESKLMQMLNQTIKVGKRCISKTIQPKDRLAVIGVEPVNPAMYYALAYGTNSVLTSLYAGKVLSEFYMGNYPKHFVHFKPERTTL